MSLRAQISSVRFFVFKNAFISKQNEWTDQLKYCPSLPITFSHLSDNFRIPSRKNDLSLEAIQFWNQFSISAKEVNRWLAKSCCILRNNRNQKKQCPEAGAVKTFHLSVSKYFFTTLATWGRALSWRRITFSCLCSYSVFLTMHGSNESIVADTDRP